MPCITSTFIHCDERNNTQSIINDHGFVCDLYLKFHGEDIFRKISTVCTKYQLTLEEVVGQFSGN